MAVLRSSALRRLHMSRMSGRSRHTAWLVGIVLTSVICVCLSGTRQHHGRETNTLQRVTELKPTLYLKGGSRSATIYKPYTCTHRLRCRTTKYTHNDSPTGKYRHTPNLRRGGSLSSIIKWFLGILSQTKSLQGFISIECHDRWSSGVKILFV